MYIHIILSENSQKLKSIHYIIVLYFLLFSYRESRGDGIYEVGIDFVRLDCVFFTLFVGNFSIVHYCYRGIYVH